jgi:quercetin dioxygenase-like cupin family protein
MCSKGENLMKAIFALLACAMLISQAHGEGIKRNELKRADLTGKDMDIIVTVLEVPPGESLAKHIHPGEEVVYVLEGATLELPDGKQVQFPAGGATINARDVPHAGVKVVGDKTLKMLNVHIVDKGKPVTEFVK